MKVTVDAMLGAASLLHAEARHRAEVDANGAWRLDTLMASHKVTSGYNAIADALDGMTEDADVADLLRNGATYKRVAEVAARYITDIASMDARGRAAAFDALLEVVGELPDDVRYPPR